jgi:hypothetical protein
LSVTISRSCGLSWVKRAKRVESPRMVPPQRHRRGGSRRNGGQPDGPSVRSIAQAIRVACHYWRWFRSPGAERTVPAMRAVKLPVIEVVLAGWLGSFPRFRFVLSVSLERARVYLPTPAKARSFRRGSTIWGVRCCRAGENENAGRNRHRQRRGDRVGREVDCTPVH